MFLEVKDTDNEPYLVNLDKVSVIKSDIDDRHLSEIGWMTENNESDESDESLLLGLVMTVNEPYEQLKARVLKAQVNTVKRKVKS